MKRRNNMFIKKLSTGIILGVLLILPISARSQGSAFIGPHVGIQKTSGSEGSNYLIGATLRLHLLPAIGVEGDFGYRQERFGGGAVTLKQWPITVTGLLYPIPFLYGGLGAGWYSTTFDYSDQYNAAGFTDETTRKTGWHLAAGVEIPASPRVHLFGDVRYVFLNYKFKNLPGAVLDGAKANFYSLNAGLLFRL
jgi:opacity protein-like surface antigen